MMNTYEDILIELLMSEEAYKLGIVPVSTSRLSPNSDANRSFVGTTPEEARRSKRKFRKLWRSLARSRSTGEVEDLIRGSDEAHRLGLGEYSPKRHHLVARKLSVMWELRRRAREKAAR